MAENAYRKQFTRAKDHARRNLLARNFVVFDLKDPDHLASISTIRCPKCGSILPLDIEKVKMGPIEIKCDACGYAFLLTDGPNRKLSNMPKRKE